MSALEKDRAQLTVGLGSLGQKLDEVTTEINTQKGRLDTAIAEYQQQFLQAESQRREEFVKAKAE